MWKCLILAILLASCTDKPVSKPDAKKAVPGKVVAGYDIAGKAAHCIPAPKDIICTEIFTPEDKFAQDCAKEGAVATQCECHKFICSQAIHNK